MNDNNASDHLPQLEKESEQAKMKGKLLALFRQVSGERSVKAIVSGILACEADERDIARFIIHHLSLFSENYYMLLQFLEQTLEQQKQYEDLLFKKRNVDV